VARPDHRKASRLLACGLLAGTLPVVPRAQAPASQVFVGRTDIVPVYVAVTDRDGRPVEDLGAGDFAVMADGHRQVIQLFSAAPHPIAVVIAFDWNGLSLLAAGVYRSVEAAQALTGALAPDDEVAVGSRDRLIAPRTLNKAAVIDLLRGNRWSADWTPASRPTPTDLDWALATLEPATGRRLIFLFTEGSGYFAPAVAAGSFAKRAAKADIALHAIAFEDSRIDPAFMRAMADQGGSAVLLSRGADLAKTFHEIVDELHREYLLGFAPATFDGKRHSIEVKVARPNVTIRARRSYVADIKR